MTYQFQSFDYEFQVFTHELWCVYIIIFKCVYKVCVEEAGRSL